MEKNGAQRHIRPLYVFILKGKSHQENITLMPKRSWSVLEIRLCVAIFCMPVIGIFDKFEINYANVLNSIIVGEMKLKIKKM